MGIITFWPAPGFPQLLRVLCPRSRSNPCPVSPQISSCGFGGLAWMPGVQTWLLSDPWNGINDRLGEQRQLKHPHTTVSGSSRCRCLNIVLFSQQLSGACRLSPGQCPPSECYLMMPNLFPTHAPPALQRPSTRTCTTWVWGTRKWIGLRPGGRRASQQLLVAWACLCMKLAACWA